MAKLFFHKVSKYAWVIVVAIVIAFILLMIFGYTMQPDKTWGP